MISSRLLGYAWKTLSPICDEIKEAGSCRPPPIKLRGLPNLLHPFFHVFGRYIFHVRGHAPQMSEGILNEAGAVAIELVFHRLQDFRTFRGCAFNHGIDVGEVYIQTHRARAYSRR